MVQELPEKYKELAVAFTQELVRRDSSNPPGNELETAIYAVQALQAYGIEAVLDEFEPGRCNVTATYGGCRDTGILFLGHMDVVPAKGCWEHGKFDPEIVEGRMYGRGTADMKGGIGAMMAAVVAMAQAGVPLAKNVQLLLDSDEENTNKGINRACGTYKIQADCAIVGEPSDMQLLLGNKGYASFYVRTQGVSCHASEPAHGKNAIYAMAKAIQKLEAYADGLSAYADPYLGSATLSVGTIQGGVRVNIVPDACVCEVERRALPGEILDSICRELQHTLGDLAEVSPRNQFTPASLLPRDHAFTRRTKALLAAVLQKEPALGVFHGGTEAAYVSQFGIPTLIVGPGSLEQAHRVDEYAPVEQIKQCADLYFRLMQSVCCPGAAQ